MEWPLLIYQRLLISVNDERETNDLISHFAHSDADGELEHLLPVCMDKNCLDSAIYVRDNDLVSIDMMSKMFQLKNIFSGTDYRSNLAMEFVFHE